MRETAFRIGAVVVAGFCSWCFWQLDITFIQAILLIVTSVLFLSYAVFGDDLVRRGHRRGHLIRHVISCICGFLAAAVSIWYKQPFVLTAVICLFTPILLTRVLPLLVRIADPFSNYSDEP